ncbi:MAG TPA: DUF92 domain-containing protein [bacterium]|jgi:uncharacterized protein (TIGR00297 family)|nr:DUF92 domain-containing protein [bacterium]
MSPQIWIAGAWVNLALALACMALGLLSVSGCVAALMIGAAIWGCLGWQGWLVLLVFFLGGTAATKFQYGAKRRLGVAQENAGRRSWKHAWANAGAGVLCAAFSLYFALRGDGQHRQAWAWAFVACFAAALSDTLSSEFGQLAGKPPRLITTGETVPTGTDGGITLAGTLMGLLGAALLSLLGRFIGLTPVRATFPIMLAGLSGNLLDSWLGATLQRRGRMTNEMVNFANTCGGAALGFAGFWFMQWLPHGVQHLGFRFLEDFFV